MSYPPSFLSAAIRNDRPLFCVIVCQRADDANLPDVPRIGSPDGEGVDRRGVVIDEDEAFEMALDALRAVWLDVLASPEGDYRGPEVVVKVCLPDGTLLGDMSS